MRAYLRLAPGYIEIDIPVDRDKTRSGFWIEKHRTELSDVGSSGILLVYRQVGFASVTQAWKNEAELFAYFEERLSQLDWKFSIAGIHHRIAPESHLLGAQNHRMYNRRMTAPARS